MDNLFYLKIRKYGFWLLAGIALLISIYVGLVVDYPPSNEQLMISTNNFMLIRWSSLVLVMVGIHSIYRIINNSTGSNIIGKIFGLVLLSSPVIMGMWLSRPLESMKFFAVMLGFYVVSKVKRKGVGMIVLISLLIGFCYFQNSDKANIFYMVNIKELARQTEEKFLREDDLVDRIYLPLWFRRIAYNKVSMLTRNVSKELISFWNLEIFFYQEFPPNSNKALIIFYWPLIVPFGFGLYFLVTQRNKKLTWICRSLLAIAWINFLFSSSTENFRYILAVPLVGLIIGLGFWLLRRAKLFLAVLIFFWLYGWQVFAYDFNKRSDYWLDNRPMVYQFIFNELANIKPDQKVIVTDIAGNAKNYCKYYLKNMCSDNFSFQLFNLTEAEPVSGVIYAGFEGQFLGSDLNNKFSYNARDLILSKGFDEIGIFKVRDSIAYRYGELIFVGLKR